MIIERAYQRLYISMSPMAPRALEWVTFLLAIKSCFCAKWDESSFCGRWTIAAHRAKAALCLMLGLRGGDDWRHDTAACLQDPSNSGRWLFVEVGYGWGNWFAFIQEDWDEVSW